MSPQEKKEDNPTCCYVFSFLGFLALVGTAGFFIWYLAIRKGSEDGDLFGKSPTSSVNNTQPTLFPTASPSFAPSTSTPFPTGQNFAKLCENTAGMNNFLQKNINNKFYLIEMVQFKDVTKTGSYDRYYSELRDLNTLFYMKEGDNIYDQILITEFDGGGDFTDKIMENNDADFVTALEERGKQLSRDDIFVAKLNAEISTLYPNLVNGVNDSSTAPYSPVAFHVHGMKFVTSPYDGRLDVAKFDAETATLRSDNNVFGQAWFDVQAACRGTNQKYDQVRIESIKSWTDYANVISRQSWVDAQSDRNKGLDSSISFTETVTADEFTNMY